ncbi:hypothetical protein GKG47_09615 [Lactonifactor sp. BIOML-A3]|uniref:hypothetical protein n=1 Tax=unclassified Lactonifactor TaxID=2636670 RepID=UPI0012AF8B08|nr:MULTISPECIES: hypothetical protein [unclassified Lactonifactor]MSA01755.1 hypothetical protein [Lactonifactor sp. BIOML-A5]MSA08269.1 hypothetical protein [Lactonifactor sp. BIOML-A4]MSA12691.1 hypothetical protein [Lactonifactor sp. BIOML-A3]MSA17331.1 hypothetical protein [Lactonifactor sp. BIOML-A2]MSA37908.1 hypothetical protein [Lactonifactor sp. BIOML-A1]
MSILSELNTLFEAANIPVETGVFSGVPPDEYLVLTPLTDTFAVYGDNKPLADVSEVRISLFSKNNYLQRKNQLVRMLLQTDFVITDRRYIGHEDDTGYHHYAIDVAKEYELEE